MSVEDNLLQQAYPSLEELVALKPSAEVLDLSTVARHPARRNGHWQTRVKGRGMTFAEVREYRAGDDMRSVDWRVTARTGQLHTRLYSEERERPVLLAADLRSPMLFGSRWRLKAPLACGALAMLGWAACAQGDRIGAALLEDHQHQLLRPAKGSRAMLNIAGHLVDTAKALTDPSASYSSTLYQLLQQLQFVAVPGGKLFLASDFHDLDDACFDLLLLLSRHQQLTLLWLNDPLERQLQQAVGLWVTDGERRQRLAKTTARSLELRQQQLQQLVEKNGIELLSLATDKPLIDTLQWRYGRRESLRGTMR